MDLLDASALIAFFAREPAAPQVRRLLGGETGITSVHLAEAANVLARLHGVTIDELRRSVEAIPGLSLMAVDPAMGWRAGDIRARHYHRTRCPLSLADCVLVAAADPHDRIATSDKQLAVIARAEGIGVVSLPSSG